MNSNNAPILPINLYKIKRDTTSGKPNIVWWHEIEHNSPLTVEVGGKTYCLPVE